MRRVTEKRDPITIALGALAIGGAASGAGQIIQGVEANKEAKRAAAETIRVGQQQASAVRERGAVEASAKRAAAGASGLGGQGTLLSSIASIFEASTQSNEILTSSAVSAYNIRKQGKNAQKAGIIGGVGSIFTGLGQAGALGFDAGIFGGGSSAGASTSSGGIFAPGAPTPTLGFSRGF